METDGGDEVPADDLIPDALTPYARRMDVLGVVIDRIIDAEKDIATAYAHRAVLVESARVLSVANAEADVADAAAAGHRHSSVNGWSPLVVAHRELQAELACALRMPQPTAGALIHHSRVLAEDLPATRAALSAGQISYRHAQTLIDHATSLPTTGDAPGARAVFENAVLPFAMSLTVTKFDKKARILRERTHPDTIATRTRKARDDRNVWVDPARDGMAYLSAYLPAPTAYAAYNRVDDIATSLQGAGEPRTHAQLRADALADLLIDGTTDPAPDQDPAPDDDPDLPPTLVTDDDLPELFALQLEGHTLYGVEQSIDQIKTDLNASITEKLTLQASREVANPHTGVGHGIRATVMITVPALTLLDRDDDPAILDGYGPIDPDTARQLAATAPTFIRILTHPETGAVLSIGRNRYTVPADLRTYLQIRDQTCRYPGCNKPVRRRDIDHSRDWVNGGTTSHDNLAHLCRADTN